MTNNRAPCCARRNAIAPAVEEPVVRPANGWRALAPAARALLMVAFVLESGCASLPAKETAAFGAIASSSQASFTNLSSAEADALRAGQLAKIASRQRNL